MSEKVLIDPWGAILIEDYRKVIEMFGLEFFTDDLLSQLPRPNRLMRRKVVFCHRGFARIVEAIKENRPFYALTGITASSEKIHLGTKMVVENMRYFQDQGARTFLLIADMESAAVRDVSLKEAKKWPLDFHIPAYIALGMDPKKTIFYFQSENRTIAQLACSFARKVTLSELRAIYGAIDPGKILAALLDASDILYPQLREKIPGVIPVAIDQDPHLRLTRDIVKRTKREFNFIPPASIYHKFTPSLDGAIKMSKSKPESCIDIPEDPKVVERRIKNAFTGGRATLEEQKRLGGRPEICVVFELFKQHLIEQDKELDEIYSKCKSGALACGECKEYAAELMTNFLMEFEEKFEKSKEIVPELTFVTT